MTTAIPETDPLETYESMPAVSFHEPNGGYPMGKWAKFTVRDWPKLLEQKDEDGNVERWDNGDAKLVLVVPVTDLQDGEDKNIWAKKMGKNKPHSLFQQFAAAQKKVREASGDATYRVGPGDSIAAKFASEDRSVKAIKGNFPKNYEVVIKPGQRPVTTADPLEQPAAESEDPWSDATPSGASAPAQVGADPFPDAAPDEGDEPPF